MTKPDPSKSLKMYLHVGIEGGPMAEASWDLVLEQGETAKQAVEKLFDYLVGEANNEYEG